MSGAHNDPDRPVRGFVLGKFLPPHRGHQALIDFARFHCQELVVLVCTLDREPIDGPQRVLWMREMFPSVRVVHCAEELPQEPGDHPDFWKIWRDVVRRYCPEPIDLVFAGEPYGARLADVVGARFIPFGRQLVKTSGTAVREDPIALWDQLPEVVRPYFVRRVCVFGPESTGKTTLARDLARHFGTTWAHEHARPLLDLQAGECFEHDIPRIVRGQMAVEDALARQANRVLFVDTDALTTTVWAEVLFGSCPEWVRTEARERRYELTLLCDIDVPWVDDEQRFLGTTEQRREFLARCERALQDAGRDYVWIRGKWDKRMRAAVAATVGLLEG